MGWSGVYRLSGEARDRGRNLAWSLILKVVLSPERGGDPHHACEVQAYRSGILDDLPGSLAAPRCFGVVESERGRYYVWLEEVRDEIGPRWPLERYGVAARHLGQMGGAYLVGRPLPLCPWASDSLLRALAAEAAPTAARLRGLLDHPLAGRAYPPRAADHMLRLWDERETFLTALDRLPRTLCHHDGFRGNLFARRASDGSDQTVAIDWAYSGPGAVGEDLVPLVVASVSFGHVEASSRKDLEAVVFEGYLDGLRDADWRGDPRLVRLGYTASACLRYGLLIPVTVVLPLLRDDARVAAAEASMGRPITEYIDAGQEGRAYLLELADEARELLPLVG